MGYQTGDDGCTKRDGITTLMSHQSGILHSLIFCALMPDNISFHITICSTFHILYYLFICRSEC